MPDRGCYIVTGGAGFIGSNLAAALAKQDPASEVIVIDDLRSGSFANLVEAFDRAGLPPFSSRFIAASLDQLDASALVATRGLKAVFHMAGASDPAFGEAELIRANTAAFDPLLIAAVQAGMPFIYASSSAVYGTPPQAALRRPFPLEAAGRPTCPLGFSKWLMECAHARAGGRTALGQPHVVGLRYFDVFGPGESRRGDRASFVHKAAAQLLSGKRPTLPADSAEPRDVIFVDDAVAATLAALGIGTNVRPRPGVYNVGSGTPTAFSQALGALREELAIPESAQPTEQGTPSGPAGFTHADLSATAAGLGWKPTSNPLDAIRTYARWLKTSTGR